MAPETLVLLSSLLISLRFSNGTSHLASLAPRSDHDESYRRHWSLRRYLLALLNRSLNRSMSLLLHVEMITYWTTDTRMTADPQWIGFYSLAAELELHTIQASYTCSSVIVSFIRILSSSEALEIVEYHNSRLVISQVPKLEPVNGPSFPLLFHPIYHVEEAAFSVPSNAACLRQPWVKSLSPQQCSVFSFLSFLHQFQFPLPCYHHTFMFIMSSWTGYQHFIAVCSCLTILIAIGRLLYDLGPWVKGLYLRGGTNLAKLLRGKPCTKSP